MHRVTTERRGRVLVIRMDRPDKRNAVDAAMTAELDAALNTLEDDPELWCGVLTGGPDMFCAGTDLKGGPGTPTERGGNYGVVKRRRSTPLVAAVDGIALGGGFEIVLSCDLVVAGRSARFGLPEVSRGVIANCGALFRAQRPLPLNIAKQMLLTGQPLSATRAHELGLVSEVVDDGTALEGALVLAEQICRNSPFAVGETLKAVEQVVGATDEAGWAATAEALSAILASADRREGVQAFLEKREPQWVGR
ncbi:enoyl-CoA hydratase-related protein [Parafrankia sp. EUN1f]|uniref:enoyl-CoA hydratase-related protein n=1 Tax=Parafrankia sp. EUN1f TaxID=102897 RepID=UPI0001C4422C|nr:enoyl-CoA hydratase-related protein [Parafrankia sp. EUN1f]EFC85788.1 Enoyl-CoA hydratase/isomerase [Parafrankia sp. EUN1f]